MSAPLTDRRIWITGASSGIGASLAEGLLERGNRVVLSARRADALRDLADGYPERALVVPLDVTDPASVLAAGRAIDETFGALDVAILNAGTCEYVDSQQLESAMIERVMEVNFMGVVRCTEAALPLLRKGDRPHLVGMSSTVAFVPLPRAEAYGASKAAVQYFLESLRVDLTREKIDVSVIYPGFVKTPLTDKNDFPMPMMVTAEESTRYIINGIRKRKKNISYPFVFSMMLRILGSLPVGLRNSICQRMVNS